MLISNIDPNNKIVITKIKDSYYMERVAYNQGLDPQFFEVSYIYYITFASSMSKNVLRRVFQYLWNLQLAISLTYTISIWSINKND